MIKFYPTLLLLVLLSIKAESQYIPDSNFATGIANACPTCIDGNHYLTADAQTLTSLTPAYSGITDLTGLDGFTNLQSFYCYSQNISNFPALPPNLIKLWVPLNELTTLPPLPASLQSLECWENNLSSLPPLPANLHYLDCSSNGLISLQTLPSSLDTVYCNENSLTALPTLPLTLKILECEWNNILALPSLPSSLVNFDCAFNEITTLPVLPNSLRELSVDGNQLTTLPSLPTDIRLLGCASNFLTSIPSLPDSLTYFSCSGNELINLPPLPTILSELHCNNNPMTHLPSLSYSLTKLDAYECQLTDVPPLPSGLEELEVDHNSISALPELPSSLNILYVDNNPISCLPFLPSSLGDASFGATNITCLPNLPNGYLYGYNGWPICDAGNLNGCIVYPTISGNVYSDVNGNATFDIGEYHAENIVVAANPGNYIGISDTAGNYKINVPLGITETTQVAPVSIYYNAPSTSYTETFDSTNCQFSMNNNFGILWINNGANLNINMVSPSFMPGFNSNFYFSVENVGTTNVDGSVTFTFDPALTFVSADQGGLAAGNVVTWNFNGLHSFHTLTFTSTINTPVTTPLGTLVTNAANATVSSNADIDLTNNSESNSGAVVGSFDPNDKEVNDATLTPDELLNGKYLEYTIHFQNTGTAPATFINVVDTLSENLDALTFEMIASSHHYDITLANDLTKENHPVFVKWLFNNIQLPDSATDFANSQGFVKFRIKPKNDLLIGDQIQNTAGIYFDFNEPVLTNTTLTSVALSEGISNLNGSHFSASIFPNPTTDKTTIHLDRITSSQLLLEVINEVGMIVMQKNISVQSESLDIGLDLKKFASGIYTVRMKSSSYLRAMKLVKEE